jgi:hypothetical protein
VPLGPRRAAAGHAARRRTAAHYGTRPSVVRLLWRVSAQRGGHRGGGGGEGAAPAQPRRQGLGYDEQGEGQLRQRGEQDAAPAPPPRHALGRLGESAARIEPALCGGRARGGAGWPGREGPAALSQRHG